MKKILVALSLFLSTNAIAGVHTRIVGVGAVENGQTVCRIPFDGTNDQVKFFDVMGNQLSVSGITHLSTGATMYGTTSGLFGGDQDYLTIASVTSNGAFDFGSKDFTIHEWIRSVGNSNTWLWGNQDNQSGNGGGLAMEYNHTHTRLQLLYGYGATSYANSAAYTFHPVDGTWYHIAVTRSGNYIHTYINGIEQLPATDVTGRSIYPCARQWVISNGNYGASVSAGSWYGYVDEFVVVKGLALWTKNFTPPNRAAGNATSHSGDLWSQVGSLPAARDNPAVITTHEGNGLSIGGWTGSPLTSTLELDTVTKAWTANGALPKAIASMQAVRFTNGDIFAFSGTLDNGVTISSATFLYDHTAKTWTQKAFMKVPRWGCGSWLITNPATGNEAALIAGGTSGL